MKELKLSLQIPSGKDTSKGASFQTGRTPQDRFELTFSHELPVIAEVFENALSMAMFELNRYPIHYQLPSTKASTIIRFVKGLLFDKFPHLMKEAKGRFFMEKEGFRIYFKKLNSNLRPMNIPTRNSRRINNQMSIFSDDFPLLIELFVGYTLNATKDDITESVAVLIAQNQIQWVTKLNSGSLGSIIPRPTSGSDDDDDALVVRPKTV